jgi:hypothetical protein
MHDYFLDHPSPLADDRLFGGLSHLNDFLPVAAKSASWLGDRLVGVRP